MPANVWNEILSHVETKVNRHSFYTWFKPTNFVQEEGQELTVRVPNGLFRDWLTKHYADVISEAITEIQRDGMQIAFVTEGEALKSKPSPATGTPSPRSESSPSTTA